MKWQKNRHFSAWRTTVQGLIFLPQIFLPFSRQTLKEDYTHGWQGGPTDED
jgi:hypothetical protein